MIKKIILTPIQIDALKRLSTGEHIVSMPQRGEPDWCTWNGEPHTTVRQPTIEKLLKCGFIEDQVSLDSRHTGSRYVITAKGRKYHDGVLYGKSVLLEVRGTR